MPPEPTRLPLSIEYCVVCGHLARVLSLAEDILQAYPEYISALSLIPGEGGVYEVRYGSDLLHSRLASGAFPHDPDLIAALGDVIGAPPRWA